MKNRLIALTLGIVCHVLFLLGISAMAYELYFGLAAGILPIGGELGRWCNLLLILQFPILHSWLLGTSGRKLLASLFPKEIGADLVTTTFAVCASLQLIVVFVFWTPTTTIWFAPHGVLKFLLTGCYGAAWLFLVKALSDSSLALHSGFLGWGAVVRGKKPVYKKFPTQGVFQYCRQPIYLAFALILFTAPVWSPDHAVLAAIWGIYCFFGPRRKEKRFEQWYGEEYRRYQARVPYMVPVGRVKEVHDIH